MQVTNPANVNLSQIVVDSGLDLSGGDYDITMKAGRTVDGKDVNNLKIGDIDINADIAVGAHNITLGAGQTVDGKDVSTLNSVVSGSIRPWSGAISAIPSGYVLCDGNNSTPNLTDRFVLHADSDGGGTRDVGDTGGAMAHTSTLAETAAHSHTVSVGLSGSGKAESGESGSNINTGSAGSGNSHSILNKFHALAMIMKT